MKQCKFCAIRLTDKNTYQKIKSRCRECHREDRKVYYQKNYLRQRRQVRSWQLNNLDKQSAYQLMYNYRKLALAGKLNKARSLR